MSGLTEEQIAALGAPLLREHIKQRDQAGRKVSYLEGWHVIAEANRIFGFDGWSRETVMSECCYAGEYQRSVWEHGRKTDRTVTSFRCSYRAKVRITIGSLVREGSGHGHGFADNPGDAHESAEKEAETDAMKRGLMTFGNPFGLALYDKDQANVEPLPTPAPKVTQPQSNRDVLAAAYQRIRRAIELADKPSLVDEIVKVNADDFRKIKDHSGNAYTTLMELARDRRNELSGVTVKTEIVA